MKKGNNFKETVRHSLWDIVWSHIKLLPLEVFYFSRDQNLSLNHASGLEYLLQGSVSLLLFIVITNLVSNLSKGQ